MPKDSVRSPLEDWSIWRRGYWFGERTFYSDFHLGLDVIVPHGTPLREPEEGERVLQGTFRQGGNTIHFKGKSGVLYRFLHLKDFNGELGHTGSTGVSTGPHVHIDISRNGSLELTNRANFIDPEAYFAMSEYENTVVRNSASGEFSLFLGGVRRKVSEKRSGLAALTLLQRKMEIVDLPEDVYDNLTKGKDF